jgi:hypothetical protein
MIAAPLACVAVSLPQGQAAVIPVSDPVQILKG